MPENPEKSSHSPAGFSRRLGLFDTTMLVMGGIIGSGIFMNPYVVARQVHTPLLILGVWVLGGVTALIGAFIYSELAARRPHVGGQYAYIREAYHPAVAFVFGWALLLVTQTGGMAAVAITFARYFGELTGIGVSDALVASLALGILTVINCFGVRAGSNVQNALMVLKIGAILLLVGAGIFGSAPPHAAAASRAADSAAPLTAIGAAMIPVLFAYGGWQTSNFLAGEIRNPEVNLPRGLILGVIGVVLLYLAVNGVCIAVLGTDGLAATPTPASEVMRRVLGERGAVIIAAGIAVSTLGFLSQGMLTAPRVYFAMAEDRLFFPQVARIHPVSHVPVAAIAIQGVLAILIAISGTYEQILNYVVSTDFIFFGLTATTIFIFRRRARIPGGPDRGIRTPGHPWSTLFFIAVCWLVVANTVYAYPANSLIGIGIMITGIPVYLFWRKRPQ